MIANYKTIYQHLRQEGYDVYSVGQHKGICSSPYIVIRNAGTVTELSVSQTDYELLLYYPMDHYSEFEEYIDTVRDTMNALYPGLKLADDSSEHYLDEDVRAYQASLVYRTYSASKANRLT